MPLLPPPPLSLPLTTASSSPFSLSSFFRARDGKLSLGCAKQGFCWAEHSHTFLPLLSVSIFGRANIFEVNQVRRLHSRLPLVFSMSWDTCVTTERLLWVSEETGPLNSIETTKLYLRNLLWPFYYICLIFTDDTGYPVPQLPSSTWKAGGRAPLIMSFF